mgnify:CR=1 FL=1
MQQVNQGLDKPGHWKQVTIDQAIAIFVQADPSLVDHELTTLVINI